MGAYVAPGGTTTVSELADAVETVAFAAPKYTVLAAAAVPKLAPEITTVMPAGPAAGEMEVMTGVCAKHCNPMLINRQLNI